MATTIEPSRRAGEPVPLDPGRSAATADAHEASRGGRRYWPLRTNSLGLLVASYVLLTAVWAALGLFIVHVLSDTFVGHRETALSQWFEDHRTPTLNTWSHYGSLVSDTFTKLIAVPLLGAIFVIVWKRWHDFVFLATVMLLEVSVFATTAWIVGRDRPPVEQLDGSLPTNSFPSGHVAAAVAFYVGLFILARWHTRRLAVLIPMGVLAVAAPAIVITSRLYRGMHNLTDDTAGVLLGAACLFATYLALNAGVERLRRRNGDALPAHVARLDLAGDRS
jgi:undecaprenyl-diphosphatase